MASIAQPEQLPPRDRVLKVEDQEQYLKQLEPFLAFHGYRSTTFEDWLEMDPTSVVHRLINTRLSKEGMDSIQEPGEGPSPIGENAISVSCRRESKSDCTLRLGRVLSSK